MGVTIRLRHRLPAAWLLVFFIVAAGASSAAAQQAATAGPDFFFGQPRASIAVRGNWMIASARSDLFDFVTSQLTIDRSDFNTATLDAELGIRLTTRVDLMLGMEFSSATTRSEYRDFVDNAFKPINQTTQLRETSFTAGARVDLTPRGRRISRFAWIPSNLTPYVGAGAGLVRYEFQQNGDFVDFANKASVFYSIFQSEGWAPSAHVFGGADLHVYKRLYVSAQARYLWSSATLGHDFVDFDPIDLGGFRVGAGARIVF